MEAPSPTGFWEPDPYDRELNAEIVRRVLREQFSELPLRSVEFLNWGWEFDAYVVDDRWCFRFPRTAGNGRGLRGEGASIERVAAAVGDAFHLPRILFWGSAGPHFPHPFFGGPFVPGISANDPRAPLSPELADDLGRALTLIHSIVPTDEEKDELAHVTLNTGAPRDMLLEQLAQVPEIRGMVAAEFAWLEDESSVPNDYRGRLRFIHADLHPEHIIVDRATGRLSGIIDWGPAFGDPAQDFAFLLIARGLPFLERAVRAYGLPIDDEFMARTIFYARVRAIGWLADAVKRRGLLDAHLLIARRTFD